MFFHRSNRLSLCAMFAPLLIAAVFASSAPALAQSGACCLGQGCLTRSSLQCLALGGDFLGGPCSPNPCGPSGRCCTNGSCTVTAQGICLAGGGSWVQGGTCQINLCLPPGRCCISGSCTITSEFNCGGTWTAGGSCSPNPCPPPPTGACCVNGACSTTTQATCSSSWTQGGLCSPNPCPSACCTAVACTLATQTGCSNSGGVWVQGTPCLSSACVPDTCAAAYTIQPGTPAAIGDNSGATTDATTFCGASGRDVWYDFTADADGGAYLFDTRGSGRPDTMLSLFSACGGPELICNGGGGANGFSSTGVVVIAANRNLKVRVASIGSSPGGGYRLNVEQTVSASGACCPNAGGACALRTPSACVDAVFQGPGTVCQPDPCPPAGSCCGEPCCAITREVACASTWTPGGVCTPACNAPAPSNDACAGALALTLGVPATGFNCMASMDVGANCASSVKDVWYAFTADSDGGLYAFDTVGSSQPDTLLAAFTACGGTQLACDNNSAAPHARIFLMLSANQSVKIRVATAGPSQLGGGYTLNATESGLGACCRSAALPACDITPTLGCSGGVYQGDNTTCQPDPCPPTGACCPLGACCSVTTQASCTGTWTAALGCSPSPCAAPPIDGCANATAVLAGVPTLGVNCNATTDGSASCAESSKDVWYTFTSGAGVGGGGTHIFDTEGSQFDTVLTLRNDCGSAELACDDDSGTGLNSRIELSLAPSQRVTIRVAVFGASAVGGGYTLNVTPPGGVGSGACCCGAACSISAAATCVGTNRAFAGAGTTCTPYSATAPCCRADFNRSGGAPTVQDIFDFLAGYFGGVCADTNDSGGTSVQDIFDFLAAYFAGCL